MNARRRFDALRAAVVRLRLIRKGLTLGPEVVIKPTTWIERPDKTAIGRGTRINRGCALKGFGSIEIGRYCGIGEGVRLISSNHRITGLNLNAALQYRVAGDWLAGSAGKMRIEDNVWIGDNAIVLPGVTVGRGAVVAAGAVVTSDVAPYAIVAGAPARQIRQRFPDEVVEAIEELDWCDWSEEKMRANCALFELDLGDPDAAPAIRQRSPGRG